MHLTVRTTVEKPKQGVGTGMDLGQGEGCCFLEGVLEGLSAREGLSRVPMHCREKTKLSEGYRGGM